MEVLVMINVRVRTRDMPAKARVVRVIAGRSRVKYTHCTVSLLVSVASHFHR